MPDILAKLAGGDKRSIGRANEVVHLVCQQPALFGDIVSALSNDDPVIRMRAADVAEKLSAVNPGLLLPHKATFLSLAARARDKEIRWHMAQIVPRLPLGGDERKTLLAIMKSYLKDESRIVRTSALQALAELSAGEGALWRGVRPLIVKAARHGSPAEKARAAKLLSRFGGLHE
jgi:HEAT repeat protein